MRELTTVHWSGGIPGYGAVSRAGWAISVPNETRLVFSFRDALTLPEPANWVALSDGGQFAWQSHTTGEIFEGLTSTGKKGYGQHSFLYVGETLHILETVEEYQATAGGWAYVSESGQVIGYGSIYSGPPLWERVEFHDLAIGQGAQDGLCVHITGESQVRLLDAGAYFNTQVSRTNDLFTILAVNYPGGYTRVWEASSTDLRTLIVQSSPLPVPVPAPVPTSHPTLEPKPMADPLADTPLDTRILDVLQDERNKFPKPTLNADTWRRDLGDMLENTVRRVRASGFDVAMESKNDDNTAVLADGRTVAKDIIQTVENGMRTGRDFIEATGSREAKPSLGKKDFVPAGKEPVLPRDVTPGTGTGTGTQGLGVELEAGERGQAGEHAPPAPSDPPLALLLFQILSALANQTAKLEAGLADVKAEIAKGIKVRF